MTMEGIGSVSVAKDATVQTSQPVQAPVVSETKVQAATKKETGSDTKGNEKAPMQGDKVARSTVQDTVKKTNNIMTSTRCEFSYHEETHRVSIKVMDKETDEVIREIPPEKSLEMLQKMWEMAGLLVDEKR
ncbi:MAG: flagellar protein FlaG [Lachnospiraceae bacterium]|nr:flagellar protein FlaG [Lachnospiraceae bacterium]